MCSSDLARTAGTRVEAVEASTRKLIYEVTLSEDQGNFKFGSTELPDEAKAAIDKASGLVFTQKLGAATQAEWERGRSLVKDVVKTLAPDEEKIWKAALEPVAQNWAKGAPNGEAVLKAFREEVAALRK